MALGFLPDLRLTNILLTIVGIPLRKPEGYIIQNTQSFQAMLCQSKASLELVYHLVRSDNQMSLGNRKLTNTGKSMHLTGILVAEQSRGLAVTAGKIAIGLLACLVNIVLERAGHGPKCKYLLIFLFVTKYKHTVLIMIPVSGNLIQVTLCHQRSLGTHIAPLIVFQIFNPSLHGLDNLCALRHQERQALSDHVNRGKKLHLTTKLVVVTVLYVLPVCQILLKFFLLIKCGTINTLQLGLTGITMPVSHG